ncbi:MAG: Lrp/AsnC family transcriptional regulator [Candidatus Bathyarchaeota archaeon]|nr:Lrp/AsnC family transcriptional regulator [Candidatus Bathyarchaeum tardum]WGM90445.1 MAG: Lrp/AsnC family transcriptional regulator [Candidatus Bathyarchaeum tardum]WNZ29485.1 MAG: Lrp/AsnC family transcriptional regulator [Candidatus Bathyarchaeota archaeon]
MTKGKKKEKMHSLLNELLIDSSRSDRELGKIIGVSQPTISRTKKILVKKGVIQGFSAIPNFFQIGYELMALTFVKIKTNLSSIEERKKGHNIVIEWMNKQNNVVFASYCRGCDSDGLMISFHPNYKDFDHFIQKHNRELGYLLIDVKSALVNLDNDQIIKAFNFKHLAEKSRCTE